MNADETHEIEQIIADGEYYGMQTFDQSLLSLADVAGSLPKALRELGHDVRVAIPGYGAIDWDRWRPEPVASFPGPAPRRMRRRPTSISPTGTSTSSAARRSRRTAASTARRSPRTDRSSSSSRSPRSGPAARSAGSPTSCTPTTGTRRPRPTGSPLGGRRDPFYRSVGTLLTIHNLPHLGRGAGPYLGDYGLRRRRRSRRCPPDLRDSLLGLGSFPPTTSRPCRRPMRARS